MITKMIRQTVINIGSTFPFVESYSFGTWHLAIYDPGTFPHF